MSLEERLKALELRPPPKHGQHGRHGRDGKDGLPGRRGDPGPIGPQGKEGRQGQPGPIGPDGKSVAIDDVLPALLEEAKALVDAIPRPKDGEIGLQGIPGIAGAIGKQGETGPAGPRGPKGEPGEVGPMPAHRWDGTKLQFEQAPGEKWGAAVDLQGPPGAAGKTRVVGGGGTVAAANAWFPQGW